MIEEVSDEAEVRQSSSSFLSALLAPRYDRMRALLRAVLERLAALSKRAFGKPEGGGAGVDRLVLLGGWVVFIVLAHPLRRRRRR